MRFWDYLRYRRRMLLAAAVCCVIFAASFALYRLPLRAVLYPVGLCLLVGLGFAVWDYRRTLKRHRALTGCGDLTAELLRELPPPESLAEEDYRAQLLHLRQLCTELQSAADNRYRDAIEYYTTWAHQIKTPIASMRLALQGEDTALFRRLLSDLSRTEQYVEMVMAFLRLGIAELLKKYPYEVSGGQKQRAAVARAIITRPSLLLADEPTGALDSRSSDELLRLFGELNRGGQTIVMVTHSVRAASTAGRVLFIKDGEVFHQLYRGGRTEEQFYQEISGTLTLLATGGMEQ